MIEKNLINCSPREFLMQTNKIRHEAEKWLKGLSLKSLKDVRVKLTPITNEMSEDEKQIVNKENSEKVRQDTYKKISELLDRALEEHVDETLNMIALMCFIEPTEIDNYNMIDILNQMTIMLSNKDVLDFLSSLIRLAQTDIPGI